MIVPPDYKSILSVLCGFLNGFPYPSTAIRDILLERDQANLIVVLSLSVALSIGEGQAEPDEHGVLEPQLQLPVELLLLRLTLCYQH